MDQQKGAKVMSYVVEYCIKIVNVRNEMDYNMIVHGQIAKDVQNA